MPVTMNTLSCLSVNISFTWSDVLMRQLMNIYPHQRLMLNNVHYTSPTKTMLPMRKSMQRSSIQFDHMKTSWPPHRDANCSGMVMSPVHQVWPKPPCKAQWNGEEDKADRGRGVKITSGNGQAWSSESPRGQWRTGKNGENWVQNYLWCPNDPRG